MHNVEIALRTLRAHMLRSVLTLLGIVIGVAAFIIMVAVGTGARILVAEEIGSLGANLLIIEPGSSSAGGALLGAGTSRTLTEADAEAIRRDVAALHAVAPALAGTAQIVRSADNWSTAVIGITPDYLVAREWEVAAGSPIAPRDVASGAKFALIGTVVAKKLFGQSDPVGEVVRIGAAPFTIIGVLRSKGQSPEGQDQDDVVLVPLSAARIRLLGGQSTADRSAVDFILLKVINAKAMEGVEAEIRALLRERHRLRPGAPDDFSIENLEAILNATNEAAGALTVLLSVVALVSLLVGGISVTNIMLVSVTERTREVGLRIAVGARRRDILNQFLVEATVLALIGGLGGIALGIGAVIAIAELAGWPAVIEMGVLALAFGLCAVVGVLFGLYPALRASRLDPIEALRFE